MKKIILIGCGKYARDHHLPVLLDNQTRGNIEVSAILVDSNHIASTEQMLGSIRLEAHTIGVHCDIDDPEIEPSIAATASMVTDVIAEYSPDGAIVSPIPVFNYEVTKVCLQAGLDVLVEKPATCPPNCCWDENAANEISPQLAELVALAQRKKCRLLVGAQRRYESIYKWIAQHAGPLEVVGAVHARGWGTGGAVIPLEAYRRWRRFPHLTGGKIMLSGYHVIDIVTWWLGQTIGKKDVYARVFSSFDRHIYPRFIVAGENRNTEKTAAIQIQFFEDEDHRTPLCLATFLFTTAGPRRWTRETYLLVNRDHHRFTIERDHSRGVYMLPTLAERKDAQADRETIVTVPGAAGGNREPTMDFVFGLLHGGKPLYGNEVSSGSDHLNSAKLIEAAYLSAIRGRSQCVQLLF